MNFNIFCHKTKIICENIGELLKVQLSVCAAIVVTSHGVCTRKMAMFTTRLLHIVVS